MEEKIFVLGLPGSGKSTAARRIESLASSNHWLPFRFNDYDVLYDMYLKDCSNKFSSASHNGFDVHDHNMFDVALRRLETKVRHKPHTKGRRELSIIEFSRNDYQRAFKLFKPDFLQDAFFLFIEADEATCIERIRERSANPRYADDHFVSEYIFESYYHKDDRQYVAHLENFGISSKAVKVISNPAQQTLEDFHDEVEAWINPLLLLQKRISSSDKVAVHSNGVDVQVAS
jgi:AAA domain